MRNRALCACIGVCGALVIGCGGARHFPVTPESDASAVGIRYYEPSKYVLVANDGKGGLQWELLTLPDQSKLMSVDPSDTLASGETTLEFNNGMLSKQEDTQDASAVPAAAITAIETAVKSLIPLMNKPQAGSELPPPRLYKLVTTGGTWALVGEHTTEPVKITTPEAK